MGIISQVLAYYGMFIKIVTLNKTIKDALKEQYQATPEELFKTTFMMAFGRQKIKISKKFKPLTIDDISLDANKLDKALSKLVSLKIPEGDADHKNDFLNQSVPLLLEAVHIRYATKEQLAVDLSDDIRTALINAIDDYYDKFPMDQIAVNITQIKASEKLLKDHGDIQEALADIEKIIIELYELQKSNAVKNDYLDPSVIQRESASLEFLNPFRKVKAEDFEQNFPLMAKLFRKPEKFDLITGRDNLILAGGRGCGKSMILKALHAPTSVEIATKSNQGSHDFESAGLDYFGVYLKLARGYFDEIDSDCIVGKDVAQQLFQHAFNMQLLAATVSTLIECKEDLNILSYDIMAEEKIASQISFLLGEMDNPAKTFNELSFMVMREEKYIGNYLAKLRIMQEIDYKGNFTYINDFPRDFCKIIIKYIPSLKGCRIYFLLDEFENLAEFQQTIVNTITKLRPESLSIKLATRSLGIKSKKDLQGEPIQHPRDYQLYHLDWDVGETSYANMLIEICESRLKEENYSETDIRKLLETADPYWGVGKDKIVEEIRKFVLDHKKIKLEDLDEKQKTNTIHHLDYAMLYRINKSKRRPKTYAGFDAMVILSSGIVSNFLELMKITFYFAQAMGIDVKSGDKIGIDIQNDAAYKLSTSALSWISRNIPNTGSVVSSFLLDVADVIRNKLLSHTSEPEAGSIQIRDASRLDDARYSDLAKIINDAVRWSVFHSYGVESAYLPRHASDLRSNRYTINRILAPKLKISPRYRWRTEFSVNDLARLLDPTTKSRTKAALLRKHSGKIRKKANKTIPLPLKK